MGGRRTAALLAGVTAGLALVGALGGCSRDDDIALVGPAPTAAPAQVIALPSTTTTTSAPTTTTTAPPATTTTTAPPLAPPKAAASAPELASRVAAAEATTRDPATTGPALESAAFELQMLYRQLARAPDWVPAVVAAVPEPYRLAVQNNVHARQLFRSMHTKLSETLPPWRIVDPAPVDELLSYYQQGEATFGVPWPILAAVNLVETGMGRIRGTSIAGAQGPMQFMPGTWAAFGEGDVNDPHDAILAAARYLAHNGGGAGNIDNALFRYNNSTKYVEGVKAYAAVIADDPAALHGFHAWQIVYLSQLGDVWLPAGYEAHERVPAADHVARHPEHLLGSATN